VWKTNNNISMVKNSIALTGIPPIGPDLPPFIVHYLAKIGVVRN
jgi:hypothetical protein